MARAATTTDAFNAIAEPRRRLILDLLAAGERPVGELVVRLGLAQPVVSKHLRVLREVGLVQVRDVGRQRMYRIDGRPLRAVHDWLASYERLWEERFEQLDAVLEELSLEELNSSVLSSQDLDSKDVNNEDHNSKDLDGKDVNNEDLNNEDLNNAEARPGESGDDRP